MTITRRKFLTNGMAGVGTVGLASWSLPAFAQGEIMPKSGPRVVVIGGGWGGATAAKYIRLQDPSIEVVMIERESVFRSCPISNWVIGGLKEMGDITVSYNALKTKHGIKVVHDTVTEIDSFLVFGTLRPGDSFGRNDWLRSLNCIAWNYIA